MSESWYGDVEPVGANTWRPNKGRLSRDDPRFASTEKFVKGVFCGPKLQEAMDTYAVGMYHYNRFLQFIGIIAGDPGDSVIHDYIDAAGQQLQEYRMYYSKVASLIESYDRNYCSTPERMSSATHELEVAAVRPMRSMMHPDELITALKTRVENIFD